MSESAELNRLLQAATTLGVATTVERVVRVIQSFEGETVEEFKQWLLDDLDWALEEEKG